MCTVCPGETRAGARSPTGKLTDMKQLVRHDTANTATTVTDNHLVVRCFYSYCLYSFNRLIDLYVLLLCYPFELSNRDFTMLLCDSLVQGFYTYKVTTVRRYRIVCLHKVQLHASLKN